MKKGLVLASLVLLSLSLYGQMLPPDPDLQVPVDGGILTVIGASIAYGIYRSKKEGQD